MPEQMLADLKLVGLASINYSDFPKKFVMIHFGNTKIFNVLKISEIALVTKITKLSTH